MKEYNTPHYRARVACFNTNPPPKGCVLYFGDSLTEGGTWQSYYPTVAVANRGISGDNTEGMLNRFDEITQAQPQAIYILAGINDISQGISNQAILANFDQMIKRLQKETPTTRIYVESILPINNDFGRYKRLIGKENQVIILNKELEKLSSENNVFFLNINPLFQDEKGKLKSELTPDGLHLNAQGYSSWVEALNRILKETEN
jgi:lysophospholipase L1-like esterase